MKRAVMLACCACLLFSVAAAEAGNRALIIGIGQGYKEFGINPINGPARDTELALELAGKMGFVAGEIKVLRETEATRSNILQGLEWVKAGVGDGEKALIYYSGHGSQVKDTNNDEDDGCDEVLVPVDSTSQEKFILDDELDSYLSSLGNAEVLLIADSCFSGTITKSLSMKNTKNLKYLNKSTEAPQCGKPRNVKALAPFTDKGESSRKLIVLSATAPNEVAFGDLTGSGKGSLLTQAIYDIVREKGSNVTFAALRDDAANRIKKASEEKDQIPHTPQLDGNSELFGLTLKRENPSADYQGGIDQAATNRELFERVVRNSKFQVAFIADKHDLKLQERINFSITSAEDGYINIIDVDAAGKLTVLFPNQIKENNNITANRELKIPADIGGFRLEATDRGESTVYAIVTKEPLNLYKEEVGKKVSGFKSIGDSDLSSLRRTIVKRTGKGIGVKEEASNEQFFGATSWNLNVR